MNKKYFAIANSNYVFQNSNSEKKTELQTDCLRLTKAGHIEIHPIAISNISIERNTSVVRTFSGMAEFVPGFRDTTMSLKLNQKYFSPQEMQLFKVYHIVDININNRLWNMMIESITENSE